MTNLANATNCELFVRRLEICERSNALNDTESEFIRDMRRRFESREDALDMGANPWSPTSNQWNYLIACWEKCR